MARVDGRNVLRAPDAPRATISAARGESDADQLGQQLQQLPQQGPLSQPQEHEGQSQQYASVNSVIIELSYE